MKKRTGRISYDYTNMLSPAVGTRHGVTPGELRAWKTRAETAAADVRRRHESGEMEFISLPSRMKTAREIAEFARRAKNDFDDFVVLGIGGSALGAAALHCALNPPYYNLMSVRRRMGYPRFFVEDNVDPVRIANLLEVVNPKRTLFNVITKSGGTAETLAALLTVCGMIRRKTGRNALPKHLVATTDGEKGNLREIVRREKLPSFEVPRGVGGRFSVLTPVGLVPAAMTGINVIQLLRGAAAMRARCIAADAGSNPALLSALLQFLACTKKGKTIQVMMPYSVQLYFLADWYRQLWAESLGKRFDLAGRTVNAGQTPVKALGATDQHSQIQLYAEGPNDKTITFLRVEKFGTDVEIPKGFDDLDGLSYLGGASFSELLNTELRGTEIALTKAKRPNSTFVFPAITPFTVGQFIFLLEMQTVFAGGLFRVNPFDQPGVEAGKIAAFALMGRRGFEKNLEEISALESRLPRKVV
ncbi:MAG: glucose-6-phosphate isomerase [bacterium]